jgi:arylsulfatase A-like enzyme
VPFLAYGPGIPTARFNEMVSLVDVPSSILSFAGVDIPETFQGRSVTELFDGAPEDWPAEAYVEVSEADVGRAIRTHEWCFAAHAPDKSPQKDSRSDVYEDFCLYDLKNDPHELNNLVGNPEYKQIRDELAERLAARIVAIGDGPVEIREPVNV